MIFIKFRAVGLGLDHYYVDVWCLMWDYRRDARLNKHHTVTFSSVCWHVSAPPGVIKDAGFLDNQCEFEMLHSDMLRNSVINEKAVE